MVEELEGSSRRILLGCESRSPSGQCSPFVFDAVSDEKGLKDCDEYGALCKGNSYCEEPLYRDEGAIKVVSFMGIVVCISEEVVEVFAQSISK